MKNKTKRTIISLISLLAGCAVVSVAFAALYRREIINAEGISRSRRVYAVTAITESVGKIRQYASEGNSDGVLSESEKGLIYANMLDDSKTARSLSSFFSSLSESPLSTAEKEAGELYALLNTVCENGDWNASLPIPDENKDGSESVYYTDSLPVTDIVKAKKKAGNYLSTSVELSSEGLKSSGPESYVFTCENGYCEITRRGGKLVRMAIDHRITAPVLSSEECIEKAQSFVALCGYSAVPFSFSISEGMYCVSFAMANSDYEAISVGINTENGRVSFFDASVYLRDYKP